jgi:hypothetical protein
MKFFDRPTIIILAMIAVGVGGFLLFVIKGEMVGG